MCIKPANYRISIGTRYSIRDKMQLPTQHQNENQECHINEQNTVCNEQNRMSTEVNNRIKQKLIAVIVFKPRIIIAYYC